MGSVVPSSVGDDDGDPRMAGARAPPRDEDRVGEGVQGQVRRRTAALVTDLPNTGYHGRLVRVPESS